MKNLLFGLALLTLTVSGFSQEKNKKTPNEKEKYYSKDATLETDDYKVYITNAVAMGPYSKFKMRIVNKTNDYLVFKTSEIGFITDDKKVNNTEKDLVIAPNDDDFRVVDFKGTQMQADKFIIDLKGVYKASSNVKALSATNFDLPATKNDFTVGGFSCQLKKHEANTDGASAKFECKYEGDGVGILNPYKCAAIMPNGVDNANAKKHKGIVLEKGKSETFNLLFNEIHGASDLQYKAIKVKWNDTFKESKLSAIEGGKIEMTRDPAK